MPHSHPPLTIFAVPRAFQRNIGVAQRNAIQSWRALRPQPRVILLGDDSGTAEAARQFGCDHIPDIACNEFGTPLLGSIFEKAHEATAGGLMLFVNADIILTSGLMTAVSVLPDRAFLMTGRRHHLIVRQDIDFTSPDWEAVLKRRVEARGGVGGENAMDYFVFPHGLFGRVPPFAIGRGWWDHWLAAEALRRDAMLIDASPQVLAVHQDHGFLATEESVRNLALFGQSNDSVSLALATHVLRDARIIRAGQPDLRIDRLRDLMSRALIHLAGRVQARR